MAVGVLADGNIDMEGMDKEEATLWPGTNSFASALSLNYGRGGTATFY